MRGVVVLGTRRGTASDGGTRRFPSEDTPTQDTGRPENGLNEFRPFPSLLDRSSAARVKRMASATSEAKMTVAIVSGSGISWVATTVAAAHSAVRGRVRETRGIPGRGCRAGVGGLIRARHELVAPEACGALEHVSRGEFHSVPVGSAILPRRVDDRGALDRTSAL